MPLMHEVDWHAIKRQVDSAPSASTSGAVIVPPSSTSSAAATSTGTATSIPSCVSLCMERASTTGCESSTDYNCLCNSSAYTNSVGACWSVSCSQADFSYGVSYAESACRLFGVNVTITAAGGTVNPITTNTTLGPLHLTYSPWNIQAVMSSICALVLALAIGFGLNNCRKQKAKENDLAQWSNMTSTYESKTGMDPIASRGPMSFEEMLRNGPPGSGGGGGFGGFGGGNSSGQDAFEPDLAPLPRARTRGRLSRGGTPGSAYRTLSDDQMGELGELDPDAEAWEMGERSGSASASASASASGSAGASKGDPSSPKGSLSGVAKDAALASEHLEAEAAHEFHRPPSRPESDLAPSIRTSDTGHTPGVVVPPWTDVEFASTTHLNSV